MTATRVYEVIGNASANAGAGAARVRTLQRKPQKDFKPSDPSIKVIEVKEDRVRVGIDEGQPAGETSSAEKSEPPVKPQPLAGEQLKVDPKRGSGDGSGSGSKQSGPGTTGSSGSTKTALGWIAGATALSALITLWSYLSKEDKMLGLIPPPAVQGPGVAATTFGAAVCLAGFFSYNSPTDVSSSGSNGGRPINQILS